MTQRTRLVPLLAALLTVPLLAEAGPPARRVSLWEWSAGPPARSTVGNADRPIAATPTRLGRPRSLWDIPIQPAAYWLPGRLSPRRQRPPVWGGWRVPGRAVADRWRALAERHAQRFGLEPALVLAVIHAESAGNPAAVSPKNARGLMQLVPAAGGWAAVRVVTGDAGVSPPTAGQLADPDYNILLGTAYLWQLLTQELAEWAGLPWPVRRELALAAYNWGPERVRRLVGTTPPGTVAEVRALLARAPAETRAYVQRVAALLPLYTGTRLAVAW